MNFFGEQNIFLSDPVPGNNDDQFLSNKVFEHNFDVLNIKNFIVTKLDFAYQPLICIKQNGGQIVGFAERAHV